MPQWLFIRFWKTHKSWLKGLKSLLQLAKERALYGADPDSATKAVVGGNESKADSAGMKLQCFHVKMP